MSESRSRDVFDTANGSRARSGEGIEGWKVTEHQDWLESKDLALVGSPRGEGPSDIPISDLNLDQRSDSVPTVLHKFHQKHPDLQASWEETPFLVKVRPLSRVMVVA